MDKKRWIVTMVLAATVVFALSACSIEVDHNSYGPLKIEIDLPESTMQGEIAAA